MKRLVRFDFTNYRGEDSCCYIDPSHVQVISRERKGNGEYATAIVLQGETAYTDDTPKVAAYKLGLELSE